MANGMITGTEDTETCEVSFGDGSVAITNAAPESTASSEATDRYLAAWEATAKLVESGHHWVAMNASSS